MSRWRIVGVVLACALAACGGAPEAAPTATPEAPPTATPGASPEGRGVVTANADGTRTVVSEFGEAVVPAQPQRVVSVIGDIDLETMLALGVVPAGAGTQGGTIESGFAPHLPELVAEVEPLPWVDGVPFEQIAALDPDLVFTNDVETADTLSELAPVVPRGYWWGPEWKEDARYVGAVLGLQEETAALLAAFEDRAAALREELAGAVGDVTVLSAQVSHDHANVLVDPSDAFSSAVLAELGLTLAPLATPNDGEHLAVSYEQLEQLDADILFWQVRQAENGSPDVEGLEVLRGNPLYDSIPAVATGEVHEVANRPWYFPTILGAERILDDVEAALL